MTTTLESLNRYLQSIAGADVPKTAAKKGHFPFITISRQAGAGGHVLARSILAEMEKSKLPLLQGWQILDHQLCDKIIQDPHFKFPLTWLETERFEQGLTDFLSQILTGTSSQYAVYRRMALLMRRFALIGKVIIVGRGGAFVTRGLSTGLHLRLVASEYYRVQSMVDRFKLRQAEAAIEVRKNDRARDLFIRTFFKEKNPNDPLLYNAVFNVEKLTVAQIADFAVKTVSS